MDIFEKLKMLNSKKIGSNLPIEYIIIGLGNIGKKYDGTRHNAGFMTLDAIAKKYSAEVKKVKFKSLCGEAIISSKRCLLMKPSTFMNNSGEALAEAMNFYKISSNKVLVLYDDISLPPSALRIRLRGSHGGHNGMKSIIALCGTDDFPRIKIGVGQKPHPDYDLADWVLSTFKSGELKLLDVSLENAVKAAELIVSDKASEAMNLYNS